MSVLCAGAALATTIVVVSLENQRLRREEEGGDKGSSRVISSALYQVLGINQRIEMRSALGGAPSGYD